jgi:hypothetical protein
MPFGPKLASRSVAVYFSGHSQGLALIEILSIFSSFVLCELLELTLQFFKIYK